MDCKRKLSICCTILLSIVFVASFLLLGKISHQHVLAADKQSIKMGTVNPDEIVWKTYTNMSFVNDVVVEGDILWLATAGGAIEWNMTTDVYTKYTTSDGLLSNRVSSVVIDNLNRKWFGTAHGISIFDGTEWAYYTTSNSNLSSNNIYDIAIADNGDFWFGTSNGANKFDGIFWTIYDEDDYGINEDSIRAVATYGSDVWIGTWGDGVAQFDGASWIPHLLTTNPDSIKNLINDIAIGNEGIVWIGSGNSMGSAGGGGGMLTRFDGSTWITYTRTNSDLYDDYVFGVGVDSNHSVWVGTERGVDVFNGENWIHYDTYDGLTANWVEAVYIDGSDYWFGTQGGGVSKFVTPTWTTYDDTNVLVHNTIRSLASNGNEVWIGAGDFFELDGGLSHFTGYQWETFTSDNSPLPLNEVNAITQDGNDNWWFGTWDGATQYDGENWMTFDTSNGLSGQDDTRVIAANGNDVWVATYHPFCKGSTYWTPPCGGLSKFDSTTWVTYSISSTIGTEIIRDIAFDGNDVWFGTDEGAAMFNGTDWYTYTTANGLVEDYVNSVAVDQSNNIWFGTSCGGVSKFDGITWTTYTTSDGLANNCVYDIAVDANGELWFGTFRGVSHFDGITWTTYTTADGLADDYVGLVVINEEKNIWWFGTGGGVTAWYPTSSDLVLLGQDGMVTSPNDEVTIEIPANAISETTIFTYTQQLGPSESTGSVNYAGASFQIDAMNESGESVITFTVPITLEIDYDPEDVIGINEEELILYLWDTSAETWMDAAETCSPTSTYIRDLINTKLTLEICHLTEFALMGESQYWIYLPLVVR